MKTQWSKGGYRQARHVALSPVLESDGWFVHFVTSSCKFQACQSQRLPLLYALYPATNRTRRTSNRANCLSARKQCHMLAAFQAPVRKNSLSCATSKICPETSACSAFLPRILSLFSRRRLRRRRRRLCFGPVNHYRLLLWLLDRGSTLGRTLLTRSEVFYAFAS